MKKVIFIYTAACIFAAVVVQTTICQGISNPADISILKNVAKTREQHHEKQINLPANYRNNINIKAVRNFIDHFEDAKDVTWIKAIDGGYVARFTIDSVQTMVAYNRYGSWNYTIKKYAETKMPSVVRAMVKSTYFDSYIIEVKEISLQREWDNVFYQVLIKNADNFKILQICNKQMETISDFTKH